MLSSYPTDVLVLDASSALLARFARGGEHPLTRSARVSITGAFDPAPVTPALADPEKLVEAVRRLRSEAGAIDRAWVLLPDSWFRLNLIELDDLPAREDEANEIVRWSIRKTLPIPAEQMRVAWVPLSRDGTKRKVLVVSAREETLAQLEGSLRKAGVEVAAIESTGLNLWNAVSQREDTTAADRLLIHVREDEFTTALFRGNEPIFLRSRPLQGDRSIANEIKLSASYLRESVRLASVEACYLAGNAIDPAVLELARDLFAVEPTRITAASGYLARSAPGPISSTETELIAARGVFAS